MIAPSTERSGIATSATATVPIASRTSQRRTPAPACAESAARSPLSLRATAICSADPGTMRMMNAEMSTASEPYPVAPRMRAKMIVNTSASTFCAMTAAPMPAARPVSELLKAEKTVRTSAGRPLGRSQARARRQRTVRPGDRLVAMPDHAARPHPRLRRPPPLLLGSQLARIRALPRRGMGPPRVRRARPLRAHGARGLPVRALLDHDPAQARELPQRLRGLRDREGRRASTSAMSAAC